MKKLSGLALLLLAACSAPPSGKNTLPVRDDDAPVSKKTGASKDDSDIPDDPLVAPAEQGENDRGPDSSEPAPEPCNTGSVPTTSVTSEYDPTYATPAGAGGVVADGTYTLTEWWKYDGHTDPSAQERRQSLVISANGTVGQVVSQTDGAPVGRTSWSIAQEDTDLVFTLTCPKPTGTPPELRFSFRAFDDTLRLYDLVKQEESDFTK